MISIYVIISEIFIDFDGDSYINTILESLWLVKKDIDYIIYGT